MTECKYAEAAAQFIRSRADVGLTKYGTTLQGAGLSAAELLQHLREELADALVYLTGLQDMMRRDDP